MAGDDNDDDDIGTFVTPPNEIEDDEAEVSTNTPMPHKIPPAPSSSKSPPPQAVTTAAGAGGESASDSEQAPPPSSPDSRSRVRRSLQRTLRDHSLSGSHHHHRSKRNNLSVSSAGTATAEERPNDLEDDPTSSPADSPNTEVLSRHKNVFTVHGKKASVITFGSEWQNMSAEERLKVRKQAAAAAGASSSAMTSGSTSDKFFLATSSEDGEGISGVGGWQSQPKQRHQRLYLSPESSTGVLSPPNASAEHRALSMTSASTTTAASFKDASTGGGEDIPDASPAIITASGETTALPKKKISGTARSLRKSVSLPEDMMWRSNGPGAFPVDDTDSDEDSADSDGIAETGGRWHGDTMWNKGQRSASEEAKGRSGPPMRGVRTQAVGA
jgi:hypothetical protein